ncbi:hypothetical protein AwMethylo_31110 [Methylobacterium sp.]|nr:hypothetical protein AwMethylo_31110 [Methylobacterium sp.]
MRTLSRLALVGVIGSAAAACSSDASRLSDPFTNPFASNEPAATGSLPDATPPSAPPIRTGRIQSEALAAPAQVAISPRPVASAPSLASPAPATRVASVGQAGWSAQGGTTITVGPGDSLNQISTRFGVPGSAILSANGLSNASQVTAGRQIVVPVYNASGMNPGGMSARAVPAAPQERIQATKDAAKKQAEERRVADKASDDKRAQAKATEERLRKEAARKEEPKDEGKRHVRPGQTAKAEAKTETKTVKTESKPDPKAEAARKKEEARLAEAKAAKESAKADAAKKLAEAKAAKENAQKAAKAEAETKAEPVKAAAAAPAKPAEPVSTGSVAAASDQSFRWPAKGRVISGYGSSGNEGINIAVPEGTPVKAAEEGTVAYAGSDVKGYGKLVLVRHSNGYVSAYAHNGEIDVKPGEKVKRGQTIAKSGATGNVTSPQIHFEIRKGGAPIDPMSQLASN